jgi:predicted DNA-binding transcriptional regulator AlpA
MTVKATTIATQDQPEDRAQPADLLVPWQEVARRLSIGQHVVEQLAATGALPRVEIGPRLVRYRLSDVARLVRDGAPSAHA